MKKTIFVALIFSLAVLLISCSALKSSSENSGGLSHAVEKDTFDTNEVTFLSAYKKATDLGFQGTLEEFIELISGKDGVTPTFKIANGELFVSYNNGASWSSLGNVKGEDGTPGQNGENGIDGQTPTIEISDDGYWVINGTKTEYRADEDAWCSHTYVNVGVIGNACEKHSVLQHCSVCGKLTVVDENPTKAHNYFNEICTMCGDTMYSDGLELSLSDDKTYYKVTGIGTCTDTELILPSTYNGLPVTVISNDSFRYCKNIKSIKIPDSVITIGYAAFSYCTSLETVVIGANVENIDREMFKYCYALTNITVDDNNKHFKSVDGNLYTYDMTTFIMYAKGKTDASFTIPNGVTVIDIYAFADCHSLTNVVISDSVTRISSYAFNKCSQLKNINIPEGVTYIGERAFDECRNLENIVLPESLESLDYWTFGDCDMLSSVIIPANVCSYYESFVACDNLERIIVAENNEHLVSIDGVIYTKDMSTLLQYPAGRKNENFVIPDGVTKITNNAFRECKNLQNLTIPASVTEIQSVFYQCTNLQSFTVDENNEYFSSIDGNLYNKNGTELIKYALGKYSLSFEIPASVSVISSHAFAWAENLYFVEIHKDVTNIGACAFVSSPTIWIYVDENNPNYMSLDGNLYSKDGKTLIQYSLRHTEDKISIPDNVQTVAVGAFACDTTLKTVIIDNNQVICSSAFYYCTNLETIVLSENAVVDYYAFEGCTSLKYIYYEGSIENSKDLHVYYSGNSYFILATLYCYSETEPTQDGNFWHYVNGVPTVW